MGQGFYNPMGAMRQSFRHAENARQRRPPHSPGSPCQSRSEFLPGRHHTILAPAFISQLRWLILAERPPATVVDAGYHFFWPHQRMTKTTVPPRTQAPPLPMLLERVNRLRDDAARPHRGFGEVVLANVMLRLSFCPSQQTGERSLRRLYHRFQTLFALSDHPLGSGGENDALLGGRERSPEADGRLEERHRAETQ